MRNLIFIVIMFFSSCSNNQSNDKVSEHELGCSQSLTDVEFGYCFMNQNIFGGANESKWCKLASQMLPHDQSWTKQINSLDSLLSEEDMIYMLKQLDTTSHEWDCNQIQKVHCFSDNYLYSVFSIEPIIKLENGQEEYVDAWEEFRERHGNGGIHRYSFPIFNQNYFIIRVKLAN